jgi:hypothetical protein
VKVKSSIKIKTMPGAQAGLRRAFGAAMDELVREKIAEMQRQTPGLQIVIVTDDAAAAPADQARADTGAGANVGRKP